MALFQQAFIVMVLGMVVVFAFLALVIQGVTAAARIIHRIEGEPVEEAAAPAPEDERHRLRIAAAIAAAVRLVRRQQP